MLESMSVHWPFVGRADELSELLRAVRHGGYRGVLIAGVAGVGKSRLARHMFGLLAEGRRLPFDVVATRAGATVPLAALSALIRPGTPPGGEPYLTSWAVDGLRSAAQAAGPAPVPLLVDDVHLLDPASARVVHYLVRTGVFLLVATARTDGEAPDEVTALWKDGHVARQDLRALGAAEVQQLLREALGGPVGPTWVARVWRQAAPNLLYLRELVEAALRDGALQRVRGVWHWERRGVLPPSLEALLRERIGAVSDAEHDALELLALGEPLEASLLDRLVPQGTVDGLHRRGLISGDDPVRLAHPLYTEVVRHGCPATRRRRHFARLAEALDRTSVADPQGLLRRAAWQLDGGTATDTTVMRDAAQAASAMWDLVLAERLAAAAVALGGGLRAAVLLATVRAFAGDPDGAAAALDTAAADCADDDDRTVWTATWAMVRFWAKDEVDAVADRVDAVAAGLREARARDDLRAFAASLRVHQGRYADAVTDATAVLDASELSDAAAALARSVQVYGHAALGRPDSAGAAWKAARHEQAFTWDTSPQIGLALDLGRCLALLLAGRVIDANGVADGHLRRLVAAPQADRLAIGYFAAVRAVCVRLAGRADDAAERAQEANALMQATMGCPALTAGEAAHAAALTGDAVLAQRWMDEADRTARDGMRPLQHWLALARAWVTWAAGDNFEAVRTAEATHACFRADGLAGYEVYAAYDLVRLGEPEAVAGRLTELAGTVEGPLAGLCAAHADAARRDDADALLAVAGRFAKLGLYLFAGEAAAEAAGAYQRGEMADQARMAARAGRTYLPGFRRIRTPAAQRLLYPALTPRERQVAALAAEGLGNREIAARLGMTSKTAANHLNAIYSKLAVSDRVELAQMYAPEP
jgi:DNA-binding CsgD family transcriptional regulator